MKKIIKGVSYLALVALVVGPVLFYVGRISLDAVKIILNTATVIWFASAMLWMGREKESGA